MPRSNWKGIISFGLVSVPILLYPSRENSADISFHQIDKRDNARIKYQRINSSTGKVVPWADITRGYEYDKETTVPVPDDILKKVAGDKARMIDIETFVDRDKLDIMTIDNSYFLEPDKKAEKAYTILREALKATNKVGIARVIISTKEYVSAVMPHHNALILCILKYDKEMRKEDEFKIPDEDIAKYKVKKQEIDIAKQLVNSLSSKWKPEDYVDDYQASIHKWVEETVNNLPHAIPSKKPTKQTKADIVNFVDLLKKSLKTTASSKKTSSKIKPPPASRSKTSSSKHSTKH